MIDREFICTDCDASVYSFNDPDDGLDLCAVCRWIRSVPDMDEATKEKLRNRGEGGDYTMPDAAEHKP